MSLDIFIVASFLILNLGVGLYYGSGTKTINDYALGNRNFSTSTITVTIIATWIGGSDFALSLSETYKNGLWYILAGAGYALNLMVVAFLFSNKIPEFENSISVADTMGKIYGKHIRLITAISSLASTLVVLALQIKVFSTIFSYFLGISGTYATLISSFVIITYSAIGGIRAVTFTDILQLITFGVIIPIFALFIWKELGNQELISNALNSKLFNYNEIFTYNTDKSFKYASIFLCGLIPAINPTMFQRILLTKSKKQVKQCFIISSLVCLFIYLATCFIGFVIYFHNSNLNPEYLGLYVIDKYAFCGIKSIALIGIMAMIMSTADSWINTASVIFSHDICKTLNIGNNNELLVSRLFSIFLGIGVVIITLNYDHLLDLLFLSENLYIPVVTPILMLAILNFRSTTRVALLSIAAGIITATYWKYNIQEITGIESVVPGMLANFLCFFSAHYLLKEPGGWIKYDKLNKAKKSSYKELLADNLNKIMNFKLLKYCNSKLPNNNSTYLYFSFIVFLTLLTSISIKNELYHNHTYFINTLQTLILSIAVSFLCHDLWPKTFKEKYLGIVWCLSIFISLTFISSFLVLMSEFSHISLIILTIHLIIVPLLVGWRIALIMIVTGLWLSFSLYENYISEMVAGAIYNLKLKLLYLLFIVSGLSITLLKSKEEEHKSIQIYNKNLEKEVDYTQRELDNIKQGMDFLDKQLKQKEGSLKKKELYLKDQVKIRNTEISKLTDLKNEFLRNITHESNTPLIGIISMCDALYSCYDQLDNNQIKQTIKNIVNSGDRLKSYVNSIVDLSKLTSNRYKLTKEDVNLGELAKERTILYKKIFSDETKKQEFIFNIENDSIAKCDRYYITQTIDNLISNAVNYGRGKSITISIKKEEDETISFSIKDQGIGIPKSELLSIFDKFSVGSKTRTPAGGRGMGLALCKSAIEALNGTIIATSDVNGSTFTFILPK